MEERIGYPPDVTGTAARLELEVPVEPHYGQEVRRQVLALAARHAILESSLTDFLTALGEALANAFEHSRAESVAVEVNVTATHIWANIRDSGIGFINEMAPTSLPEPSAERGRGLPLMRRCCDIFHVASIPGRGTSVVVGCTLKPAR
jgi:anti-sigma regulatory factor (Ser/Thr protein kinase)